MRDAIVQVWRSVIGTPFGHMGREPGVALDCGGLILLPTLSLPLQGEDFDEPYPRRPTRCMLMEHVLRYMDRVDEPDVGDVLIASYNSGHRSQHLLGVTQLGPTRVVHAYCDCDGVGEVKESYAGPSWPGRVLAVARYRRK